jgi:hypothetical protein
MRTFLIAHTDKKGHGLAQTRIIEKDDAAARNAFRALHPDREILLTAPKGGEEE